MKKNIIPTIITFVIFAILVSLGNWQINRLEFKKKLIADIESKTTDEAVKLDPEKNINELEFTKVSVTGRFLNNFEFHLYAGGRNQNNQERSGYFILTPFRSNEGYIYLVSRGWVPENLKSPLTRKDNLIVEEVEIEGIIMRGENQSKFTPSNDYKNNIWFWIDLNTIRNNLGMNMPNFYIKQTKNAKEEVIKIGQNILNNIYNHHLEYAITWYGLAFIVILIYFIFIYQGIKTKKSNINRRIRKNVKSISNNFLSYRIKE